MLSIRIRRACAIFAGIAFLAISADAQQRITSPKDQFGHNFGDDYFLATYTQMTEYWRKLDTESDRMTVIELGKTSEGRPHLGAIVTSPENHRNLARYKDISRRLALAEGLTEAQARQLAKDGKSVVWIDGGLHASEVLGAQQLGEMIYQMVSRTDDETMRILNDVIIVFVHANPDGNELLARYYMRNPDTLSRSTSVPRRYAKYVDHDDNRDFFASTQMETENMNKLMYTEWFPQIMYNHHQTGPAGTVMFAPPFRDPFNYNFDPLIVVGIDQVGSAMFSRFIAENKPGVIMRSGSSYSTWWNGGLRTTAYFHNMIGILTETIGSPNPMTIPFNAARQLPNADYPFPIAPQTRWHFRQSVDYSITANRAILDFASTQKENVLFRIWRMGMNSIERGNKDSWTLTPRDFQAAGLVAGRGGARGGGGGGGARGGGGGGAVAGAPEAPTGMALLQRPETRDPRGFIIPSNQPDFPTATKFVNALLENGVTVQRATAQFTVAGKNYPAGSLVVKSAQAFRPHVMDMFEPQDHPDDFNPATGRPIAPYDIAGWTLAFQMGVQFDRIMEGFDGPFEKVTVFNLPMPPGRVTSGGAAPAPAQQPAGYLASHEVLNSFIALNRLLGSNEEAYWLTAPLTVGATTYPAGTLYIPRKATTLASLEKIAQTTGVSFTGVATKPTGEALKLKKLRVAVLDDGRSMPSGWTQWIMEQFEFPMEVVYAPTLDAGNLSAKYDAILLPSQMWGVAGAGAAAGGRAGGGGGGRGATPPAGGAAGAGAAAGRGAARGGAGAAADSGGAGRAGGRGAGGGGRGGGGAFVFPEDEHILRGSVSADVTLPLVKAFIENGGTVIAIGSSARSLSSALALPVHDHLQKDGFSLRDSVYAPGSVLQATVNTAHPLAAGMPAKIDMFYDDSPVFGFDANAEAQGLTKIAWFETDAPLRSGWAWGQKHLKGAITAFEARIGKGRAFMFGPEVMFRAQPHGTFKFVFNGLYLGSATPGTIP